MSRNTIGKRNVIGDRHSKNAIGFHLQMTAALAIGGGLIACDYASAQAYPTKHIRVVCAEAGSGTELVTRLITHELSAAFGQQVIVDNRGPLAGDIVKNAPADGYTLLSYGSPFWLAPLLQEHVAYDPVKDFAPIILAASAPNVLVVNPNMPIKSVAELIALAKAKPGQLNYGSGSAGSSTQIAGELFNTMANVKIIRVPYKGSGPALVGLMGGEVQLMFPAASSAAPLAKSGKLRALAVTSAKPSALAPGLPTLAEAGLPGYQSASNLGIFAPVKMSPALIALLNREILAVLQKDSLKQALFLAGEEPIGSSPAQLGATIKQEIKNYAEMSKRVAP